ncbi:MAG: menaquinone biosynthesis protein [Bacteroidales bacterium]|nr:menaquinone biosynthesis protein [Bacteroidales bacterium]
MIKISAISYLNTAPFAFGLKHSKMEEIELLWDYPAECAKKLKSGESQIALVPVGALPSIDKYEIISDFCISSNGKVRSVALLSNCPLDKIERVFLDYQSLTSVRLVKVLSKNYWKINPQWAQLSPQHNFNNFNGNDALVLIGDRVFEAEKEYKYVIDLSEAWKDFTGLPFVFAVWITKSQFKDGFLKRLNAALSHGINSIEEAVKEFEPLNINFDEAVFYLKNNISYILNADKQKAIATFLNFIKSI